MTKLEAKQYLKIVQAYINGFTIEYRTKGTGDMEEWKVETEPKFNFSRYVYRIKNISIEEYRPFNSAEECLQEMSKHSNGVFLRDNRSDHPSYYVMSLIDDYGIYGGAKSYGFRNALENFSFFDGTPFGIKEGTKESKK